jgi:hypothetical protein
VHCHRCVRRGHEQLGTIPARPAGLAKVARRHWISTVSAGSKTEVAAGFEPVRLAGGWLVAGGPVGKLSMTCSMWLCAGDCIPIM